MKFNLETSLSFTESDIPISIQFLDQDGEELTLEEDSSSLLKNSKEVDIGKDEILCKVTFSIPTPPISIKTNLKLGLQIIKTTFPAFISETLYERRNISVQELKSDTEFEFKLSRSFLSQEIQIHFRIISESRFPEVNLIPGSILFSKELAYLSYQKRGWFPILKRRNGTKEPLFTIFKEGIQDIEEDPLHEEYLAIVINSDHPDWKKAEENQDLLILLEKEICIFGLFQILLYFQTDEYAWEMIKGDKPIRSNSIARYLRYIYYEYFHDMDKEDSVYHSFIKLHKKLDGDLR